MTEKHESRPRQILNISMSFLILPPCTSLHQKLPLFMEESLQLEGWGEGVDLTSTHHPVSQALVKGASSSGDNFRSIHHPK